MNRKQRRQVGTPLGVKKAGGAKKVSSKRSDKAQQPAMEVDELEEIKALEQRIEEESPAPGTQDKSDGLRFDSLPLSRRTLQGLAQAKLEVATDIQAAAIPHALAGRDILGAAKTGSGKTLSFVLPMLEKLFRERWTTDDGLAAIIITPTRELALQIFEVLRVVGKKHQFSAGLVTGGKKEFEGEQERIIRMNILVATPGRLLHHLEQTAGFDPSQLQMLVLDEADRILDLGFKQQLDAIVSYLPTHRQTMLFSATQTKSVKDLARLSLRSPQYLAVHAEDQEVTPTQLVQNFVIVPLHEKLDVLYNFIKAHLQSKMIVFFSTCSQVRFAYELFRSLKPGVMLTALHGKIKQDRRTLIYMDFLKRPSAVMFATDIAARGLDFPNVDWVIQADAPEDSAMYIHRVGRTARYQATGRGLLLLMPQEETPVVKMLQDASIPIKKLTINPNKQQFALANKSAALLAAFPEYRNYAKKAFTGYLRSLLLLPVCPIRKLQSLPVNEFALSLGLPFTPPLPGGSAQTGDGDEDDDTPQGESGQVEQARDELRAKKNVNRTLDKLKKQIKEAKEAKKKARAEAKKNGTVYVSEGSEDEDDEEAKKKKKKEAKKSLSNAIAKPVVEGQDDAEDDFLQVKQVHNWAEANDNSAESLPVVDLSSAKQSSSAAAADVTKNSKLKIGKDGKLKVKGAAAGANKTVFDEEGNLVKDTFAVQTFKDSDKSDLQARIEKHAETLKSKVDQGREQDIERDKQRLREMRQKRKVNGKDDAAAAENVVTLGNVAASSSSSSDHESESSSDDSSSSSMSEEEGRTSYSRKRGRVQSSSDSSDDDDDSDSESDDSDAESVNVQDLKDQERRAMEILEGKKPRTR